MNIRYKAKLLIPVLSASLFAACDGGPESTPANQKSNATDEQELRNGLFTNTSEASGIKTEINYVDGLKEGEAVSYYDNGQVWKKVNYTGNKLDGLSQTFERDGSLSRSVEYKNGLLHGELAEYYKSGKKKLSVKYADGRPLPGIYRLSVRGEEVKEPQITHTRSQPPGSTNLYRVEFSLNEKFRELIIFAMPADKRLENLNEEERYGYRLPAVPGKKGSFYIDHYVEPGYFLTTDLHVYAEFQLGNGNKACVMRPVNYAIENY